MTMPAWQKRISERNTVLNELEKRMYALQQTLEEEEEGIFFYFDLAAEITLRVQAAGRESRNTSQAAAEDFLTKDVIPNIWTFAKTETEKQALMGEFLKRVVASAVEPVSNRLSDQEFHEPMRIYGVSDRTQEVPTPKL